MNKARVGEPARRLIKLTTKSLVDYLDQVLVERA